MKTVAIISEYNPFHTGHKHQIDAIRAEFGKDTAIIAIMSGNLTQRGEWAIFDKNLRAESAVRCGVNLVLELPFPFSASSAELFAKAAIHIANSIGTVDYLSFGSEIGSLDSLYEIAKNMQSDEYKEALCSLLSDDKGRAMGYPSACEAAYNSVFKQGIGADFFSANNILGLEYIKALITSNSNIKPHTIKRVGANYSAEMIEDSPHQSATAIRTLLYKDFNSALDYLPNESKNAIITAYSNNLIPCDYSRLSSAVISHFRLNSPTANTDLHDAGGGLYNRLHTASFEATDISSLIQLADTKKFTTARIRRAIWYSFFGVTSSEALDYPKYTQLLAMDSVGQAILKSIKKKSDFPIITKPASYDFLSSCAKRQKEKSDKVDFIFELTRPTKTFAGKALMTSPFIIK